MHKNKTYPRVPRSVIENKEKNKSLPSRQYAEILEKYTPEPDPILSCKNKEAIIKSFSIKEGKE